MMNMLAIIQVKCDRAESEQFLKDNASFIDY